MRNVRAKLSDEAYEAIEDYCAERGITMTALFEAFGQRLFRGEFPPSEAEDQVIAEARAIMAARRSRRP